MTHRTQPGPGARGWIRLMLLACAIFFAGGAHALTGQQLYDSNCGTSGGCHSSPPATGEAPMTSAGNMPLNAANAPNIITYAAGAGMASFPTLTAADFTSIASYLGTLLPANNPNNQAIPYNSPGVTFGIPNHSALPSPWGATTSFASVSGPSKGVVSYNAAAGTMTYTPSAGQFGSDSWTYRASGPGGNSSTRTATVIIANPPPPVVTGATLTGQTGVFFTHTIVATNNPTSYTLSGGSLPTGVGLNTSTGVISGTPTAVGAFSAQITATNAGGTSAAASFNITISLGPPVITSGTPATGAEGVAYGGYTITATNTPTSFNVVGSLPPGLNINTATGAITGTPSVTAGPYPKTYTVTVQATNGTGTGSASRTFTIDKPVPTITSGTSANGQTGVAFNYAIVATQGPITSYSATALPPGLVFNTSTGVISGTPTAQTTPTLTVTLTATNSTGTSATFDLVITIGLGPPVITSTLAASAGEGQAFNYQITATNPPLTSYNATGLPSGLTVNTSTGQITGSPAAGTAAGSPYNVNISATNGTATGSATLVITLSQFAPSITSTSPANGQTGVPFSYQITAANAPVTFNETNLPPGLSINTSTGLISGTPTAVGTFSGNMTAGNGSGTDTKPLVINITLGPPVVTSGATASGAAGFAFSYQITASNTPTSFGATGLPPGVTVNTATGLVSGTPSANGTYTATISATNGTGTGTKTLTITVAVGLPVITSAATATAATGSPFTYQITATNTPTSFNAVNLPAGLSIDTATGVISGQVTVFGGYDITLQATNGTGTGSRAFTLTVSQSAPGMTSAATASGGVGQPFSFQVTSSNGPTRIDAAGLPPGLTIDPASGIISGTPTQGGTYPVRLSIANTQATVTSTLTITIAYKAPTAQDLSVDVVYETVTPIALPVAGQVSQVTIVSLPNHGIVSVNGATATYTPANGYSGEDSFTYTASNPGGTTQVATVHINVGTLAPVASAATMLCDVNKSATTDLAHFIKASGLTGVSITTQPLHGKVSVNGTQVTYTPSTDYFGPDSFAYVAYGNAGKSSPAPVSVTVVGRPDPTRDANVTGLIDAQAQAAQRFSNAQIGNFQRRMEALHNAPPPAEAARTSSAEPAGSAATQGRIPAPAAAAEASGPVAARAPTVGLMPVSLVAPFASLATTRALDLNASTGGGSGPTGWTEGVNAWIGGTAQFGRRDADNEIAGLRFTTDGISAGVDRRMSARLVLGLGVGYGRDDTDVGTAGSRSKAKGQSFALYGSYQPTANVFLDMLAGLGNLDFDTRRHVAAIDQFATGSRKGDQSFFSLTAGAEWRREGVLVSPYGRVDVTDDRLKAYSESGVGDYALAYDAMHVRSTQVAAGVRAESSHGTDFGSVQPRLRAEYRRELRDDAQATLRYLDLFDGPQYSVTTKGVSRNALLLGVGSDFVFRGGLKVGLDYTAQRASGASNVQTVRLLVSQDLDAHGSPFSWQPSMFKDPVGVEMGYTFDDNVTRGRNEAEKLSDSIFSLSVGQPIPVKLGALTNVRLMVTPAISGEMLRRYSGLARVSAGATGELQYRTSGAFDATTFALVGRAAYDQYDSDVRKGGRYFAGFNARRSLTDRIDLFAEAGRAMRDGKSEVFQTREWTGKVNLDYALGGTRGILYLSGEYRRGDIVSTGVASLANVGLADVFVPDDAFEGMFAYRFDGHTVLGTIGWNYPLGPRDSLDLSYRRVQSTPSGHTSWDSGSLRYIDNQYSLVYLMRF